MDYFIFIILGTVFLFLTYKVGIKENLYFISMLNKDDVNKIANKKSISKKFEAYYLFMCIISLGCAYITKYYGSIGLGFSMTILMILFFISIIMAIKFYWSL